MRLKGVDFGCETVTSHDMRDIVPHHVRIAMVTCTAKYSSVHLLTELPNVYEARVGGIMLYEEDDCTSLPSSSSSSSSSELISLSSLSLPSPPLPSSVTHLKVTLLHRANMDASLSEIARLIPLTTLKTLELEVHTTKCNITGLPLSVTFPNLEEFCYHGPVSYDDDDDDAWDGMCQRLTEMNSLRRLTLGGKIKRDGVACTIPLVVAATPGSTTQCRRSSCQHLSCSLSQHERKSRK